MVVIEFIEQQCQHPTPTPGIEQKAWLDTINYCFNFLFSGHQSRWWEIPVVIHPEKQFVFWKITDLFPCLEKTSIFD